MKTFSAVLSTQSKDGYTTCGLLDVNIFVLDLSEQICTHLSM